MGAVPKVFVEVLGVHGHMQRRCTRFSGPGLEEGSGVVLEAGSWSSWWLLRSCGTEEASGRKAQARARALQEEGAHGG